MTQEPAGTREEVLARLARHRGELARFRVASLALFGSAARGDLEVRSDVDMLVTFAGPATFDGYMDLKSFLENLLGRRVDLVTSGALKPALRSRIAHELVHVA
jgi:predicted nucleotidyltransferase